MAYKPGTRKKPAGSRKKAAISGKDKAKAAWATVKDMRRVAADQWDTAKLIALVTKEEGVAAAKKLKKALSSQAAKDTYKDLPKHIKNVPKTLYRDIIPKTVDYAVKNPKGVAIEAAMFTPPGKVARGVKKIYNTAKNIQRPVPAMKKGGPVKKCRVDGIAKRGFTKAYSMKKGK